MVNIGKHQRKSMLTQIQTLGVHGPLELKKDISYVIKIKCMPLFQDRFTDLFHLDVNIFKVNDVILPTFLLVHHSSLIGL